MKKFNFRLEKNLNIARQIENEARIQHQNFLRERDQLAEQLAILEQRLQILMQSIRNIEGDVQEIILYKDYISVLRKAIQDKEQELDYAEILLEKSRLNLLEKSRETKTLEKLKEREWEEYLLENNRQEQKNIDEVAVTSYFRKNS
ncbi:MAG: flagellar export protein FliJ [Syntrophomonadaceae bacterium]|jgi:flagellar FliJ protein